MNKYHDFDRDALMDLISDLEFDLQDARDHITDMEDQIEDLRLLNEKGLEPVWSIDKTNDGTIILYAGDWPCPQWVIKKIADSVQDMIIPIYQWDKSTSRLIKKE